MKKKILIFVISLIGVILLDSIQALVFNNNTIIKIKEYYNGGNLNYVSRGVFVDTYNCTNGVKDSVIKGFSYSCTDIDTFEIVDTTKNMKDFSCAEALEEIYEDDKYIYYLPCIKSKYIEVRYNDLQKENIISALNNRNITISDLNKFNIDYIKYVKEENSQEFKILIKENNNQDSVLISKFNGNKIYYYSLDNATISLNNIEYDLADSISKGKISIENITNDMELKGTFYDGGTKMYSTKPNIYSYSGYYYNILVCNTIDGNNDIYIGPSFGDNELKYQTDFCK